MIDFREESKTYDGGGQRISRMVTPFKGGDFKLFVGFGGLIFFVNILRFKKKLNVLNSFLIFVRTEIGNISVPSAYIIDFSHSPL